MYPNIANEYLSKVLTRYCFDKESHYKYGLYVVV